MRYPGGEEYSAKARCPNCNEHNLFVHPTKQIVHCFSCGFGGDINLWNAAVRKACDDPNDVFDILREQGRWAEKEVWAKT